MHGDPHLHRCNVRASSARREGRGAAGKPAKLRPISAGPYRAGLSACRHATMAVRVPYHQFLFGR